MTDAKRDSAQLIESANVAASEIPHGYSGALSHQIQTAIATGARAAGIELSSSDIRSIYKHLHESDVLERDEHHTMEELYRYRMLYNAAAANAWHTEGIPVVKSKRHGDAEECFGGGWFIVSAQLPTGQISNHYRLRDWDLFAVPEVDLAPEWDGHDPAEAERRLRQHIKRNVL